MALRVEVGKGDKNRTIDYDTFSNRYEDIDWGCEDYYKPQPRYRKHGGLNIINFNSYVSEDYNGKPIKIRSLRHENQMLSKHGLIRHEDFKNTFPVSQQEKNKEEMKIDNTGIEIGFKDDE